MSVGRVVLVTKQTVYEALVARHGTRGNAAFLLQSRGDDIAPVEATHVRYQGAVQAVMAGVPREMPYTAVMQNRVASFHFRPDDVVVTIGPDGLFVNVAKYLNGQPVVAVNPDPYTIDGVVSRVAPRDIRRLLVLLHDGGAESDAIVLAEATTPEGGRLLAVNDFLVGRRDQRSARYVLTHGAVREQQSSSGVLIATGLGASGWYRSIRTAIRAAGAGGHYLPDDPAWDERRLVYAVREPFPSKDSGVVAVYGSIIDAEPFTITSHMPEGGVVCSDGVPEDALLFPAGLTVTIGIAKDTVRLVRP